MNFKLHLGYLWMIGNVALGPRWNRVSCHGREVTKDRGIFSEFEDGVQLCTYMRVEFGDMMR